jgi:hypothetical protein
MMMMMTDTDTNTNTEVRDLQADWEVFRVQAIVCPSLSTGESRYPLVRVGVHSFSVAWEFTAD